MNSRQKKIAYFNRVDVVTPNISFDIVASKTEVGSSMKIIEGFGTSSITTVSLFHCSIEDQVTLGRPISASLKLYNSTSSMTSSTKVCKFVSFASEQHDDLAQFHKIN